MYPRSGFCLLRPATYKRNGSFHLPKSATYKQNGYEKHGLQRGLAGEVAVEFRIDRFAASGSAPGYVLGGLDLRCCVRNRGYTGLLVPMSIEPLAQVRIPWVIAKLSNVAWSRSGSYVGMMIAQGLFRLFFGRGCFSFCVLI